MKRTVAAALTGVALAAVIGVGAASAADGNGPAGRLADALSGLVSKGTITQQQADEVNKALAESWAKDRAEHEQERAARTAEIDALLTKTLGMDAAEVRTQIEGGKTLLEVAGDNADELAAGMLDLVGTRLDSAVKDGRITDSQAAETLARAQERADAWLAGEDSARAGRGLGLLFGLGMGADGHGDGRGPGMHGDGRGPGMHGDGRGPGMRGGGSGQGSMGDPNTGSDQTSSTNTASSILWRT